MKKLSLLSIIVAVMAIFSSCEKNGNEAVTGVTLNYTTTSVGVGEQLNLIATVAPTKAANKSVTWESNNSFATVDASGIVTGVAVGTSTITVKTVDGGFTASCVVTVTKGSSTGGAASLNGSDYRVILMDGITFEKIASKVTEDLRPNDATNALHIWENTYLAGSAVGPNFFMETESWVSLVVGNIGWSGCGFNTSGSFDFTTLTPEHVLHIAIKSQQANSSHLFGLRDGSNRVDYVIGTSAIEGTNPSKNFTRDGEWNEIEIPMSEFFGKGLNYRNSLTNANVLEILSGGVQGHTLDIDAIFIYLPEQK